MSTQEQSTGPEKYNTNMHKVDILTCKSIQCIVRESRQQLSPSNDCEQSENLSVSACLVTIYHHDFKISVDI